MRIQAEVADNLAVRVNSLDNGDACLALVYVASRMLMLRLPRSSTDRIPLSLTRCPVSQSQGWGGKVVGSSPAAAPLRNTHGRVRAVAFSSTVTDFDVKDENMASQRGLPRGILCHLLAHDFVPSLVQAH
jgi:hypothetical protein